MRLCLIVVVVMVMGVTGFGEAEEINWEIILDGFIISDIAFDGDDIWCASGEGITKFNKSDNTVVHYTEADGLIENAKSYDCIAIDHDGFIWCGTGLGISMFDGEIWTNFHRRDNSIWGTCHDVVVDRDNNVWFATGSDVTLYTNGEWSSINQLVGEFLIVDHANNIWSGYGSNRVKYFDNEWVVYQDANQANYYCGIVDHDDVHFWGSGRYGLSVFDNEKVTSYSQIDAYSFAVDDYNVVWIGAENGVFSHVIDIVYTGSYYGEIYDIEIDTDDSVWLAIQSYDDKKGGLYKYTPDRTTTVVQSTQPETLSIIESYPNPFNAQTTLAFTMPSESMATLAVYDITGRKVRELLAGDMRAGRHCVLWDGTDGDGVSVGSGLYFSRLSAGGEVATGRMLFVK